MKKIIASTFVSAAMLAFIFVSVPAQAAPGKGAHEITHETTECASGQKVMCHGDGNLCSKTVGWDCVQNPSIQEVQ